MSRAGRGPGRRPGTPDTRGEILAAARSEFSEKGFDRTSVRGIAARAGVDPALVHHYFGGKEQVFLEAMEFAVDPAAVATTIADGPLEDMGERAVRTFLGVWSDPRSRAPFLALLRSAMAHEAAATLLRQFVSRVILARVAVRLPYPDSELRVELVASHLVGLALLRFVVRLEPLASTSEDELVALVAPTVQRYLSGGVGGPPR